MVRRLTIQLACGFALLWLIIGAMAMPLHWLRLDAMQEQPAAENTSLQTFC